MRFVYNEEGKNSQFIYALALLVTIPWIIQTKQSVIIEARISIAQFIKNAFGRILIT